jgi:triphosphoribosyl-dephospho-CoA synthase
VKMKPAKTADEIMLCAQLAAALEVSAYPKPGNVHRTADFPETRFEDFLAGSVALGPPIRRVAWRGLLASVGRLRLDQVQTGKAVKESMDAAVRWHKGGNTHLGTVLLFVPLAAAAGLCGSLDAINGASLRGNVERSINATTANDATDVFDAISETTPRTLGRLKDGQGDLSATTGRRSGIAMRLQEAMRYSSGWDGIAAEWATSMKKVFTVGYPRLVEAFARTRDINVAVVHTFLTLLWRFPDTFLARKVGLRETPYIEDAVRVGLEKTKWVAEAAGIALKLGGLSSSDGRKEVQLLDARLRMSDGGLNPGTTADLTAGSLLVALLCGWRF